MLQWCRKTWQLFFLPDIYLSPHFLFCEGLSAPIGCGLRNVFLTSADHLLTPRALDVICPQSGHELETLAPCRPCPAVPKESLLRKGCSVSEQRYAGSQTLQQAIAMAIATTLGMGIAVSARHNSGAFNIRNMLGL